MTLRIVTVGCLVLGAGLLLPFEAPLTLTLGVLLLLAFVVCGTLLFAGPGAPALDDEDAEGGSTWSSR